MQALRSSKIGIRFATLAILAVVGIAGVTVASAKDDHAPAHGGSGGHAPASNAAPKATPKAKPAPKQLAPSKDDGHADAKGDAHADPHDAEPASKPAPAKVEHEDEVPARAPSASSVSAEPTGPLTADQALALLTEGNQRWVADKERNPNATPQRREQTASGQTPFVTVLSCADSRLPIERIFDRGVGDVFVIRVAGNVAGQSETGTIEYGVEHLKTPVLVVMGHTKCGAVAAAASGARLHGALGGLVDHIRPAVDRARNLNPDATPDELVATAIRENVWQTIYDLYASSPELRTRAGNSTLKVVGAVYDIATGEVEWIGEHPWQREIIAALNARPSDSAVAASNDVPNGAHADAADDGHEGH
jgi:carbonic anhydrase